MLRLGVKTIATFDIVLTTWALPTARAMHYKSSFRYRFIPAFRFYP